MHVHGTCTVLLVGITCMAGVAAEARKCMMRGFARRLRTPTAESHTHRAANQPSGLELLGTAGERVRRCRESDGVACQGLGGGSIGEVVLWGVRQRDVGAGCKGVTGQADRRRQTFRSTCQRPCPRDCVPRWRLGDVHPHKPSHKVAALQLPAKFHPGGRAIHGHALVAVGVAVAGRHFEVVESAATERGQSSRNQNSTQHRSQSNAFWHRLPRRGGACCSVTVGACRSASAARPALQRPLMWTLHTVQ